MIKYFNRTNRKYFNPSYEDLKAIKWYVVSRFAVHPDFKSRTGAIITMGQGEMHSVSSYHKLIMRGSTEAELVAFDDA